MSYPEIQFINHASIIISYKNIHLLSDPWYSGTAFDNGWKLLYENDNDDHFSIGFFKRFKDVLIKKRIQILFQETKDKRVYKFLKNNNFLVKELLFMKPFRLSKDFSVKCLKDGFYDSALLSSCGNKKILNLNDCQINDIKKAIKLKKKVGNIDILLTQFSYAAWKGGSKNLKWRKNAARDKINSIKTQIKYLKPKYLIPFASFIYFCNKDNFYMNDSINKPNDIYKELKDEKSSILIMAPMDKFDFLNANCNDVAINFWKKRIGDVKIQEKICSSRVSIDKLKESFKIYQDRIKRNNNILLMRIIYYLSPLSFFRPVYIFLKDYGKTFEIDYVQNRFRFSTKEPMLSMKC